MTKELSYWCSNRGRQRSLLLCLVVMVRSSIVCDEILLFFTGRNGLVTTNNTIVVVQYARYVINGTGRSRSHGHLYSFFKSGGYSLVCWL